MDTQVRLALWRATGRSNRCRIPPGTHNLARPLLPSHAEERLCGIARSCCSAANGIGNLPGAGPLLAKTRVTGAFPPWSAKVEASDSRVTLAKYGYASASKI